MLAFCTEAVGKESVRVQTVFFTAFPSRARENSEKVNLGKGVSRHGSASPLERRAV